MFSAACAKSGRHGFRILKKLETDIGAATTLTPEQTVRLRGQRVRPHTSKMVQKGIRSNRVETPDLAKSLRTTSSSRRVVTT